MNAAEVAAIEQTLAVLVRQLRAEIEPLTRRLDVLEHRHAIESRVAALERRLADAGNVEPLDLKLLRGGRS
jgi:hypothetical protein